MKSVSIAFALVALSASTAFAGPPSIEGAKPMGSATAHHVAVGWPSLKYEWWNQGKGLDWALGAELVYGDWVGEYSDINIGAAFNVPLRWHLKHRNKVDIGLRFTPGLLIGEYERGRFRDDLFVIGIRAQLGVPVSVDVHEKVNIITGVSIPFSLFVVEDFQDYFVLPILGRIGVEVKANEKLFPFFLLELGPAIAFFDGNSDANLAFRAWAGLTIW